MGLRNKKGQAIIEYLLMIIMLAVTIAVAIRASNATIYNAWTGLTRQIAAPCNSCTTEIGPEL